MATDNRTPDDLQEAVAATLRRLRGEVRSQDPATGIERTEPQFSSPLGERVPPVAARADNLEEPDLLTGADPEIPPTPAGRSALGEDAIAYQEQAARGRLRWLPYALSLTAIVVFAGIVWWAYQAILDAPKNGPVPVIAADQTPPKVPPADQGAATRSGQEKTVYDQISGANTQPKTEVLLPPLKRPRPRRRQPPRLPPARRHPRRRRRKPRRPSRQFRSRRPRRRAARPTGRRPRNKPCLRRTLARRTRAHRPARRQGPRTRQRPRNRQPRPRRTRAPRRLGRPRPPTSICRACLRSRRVRLSRRLVCRQPTWSTTRVRRGQRPRPRRLPTTSIFSWRR